MAIFGSIAPPPSGQGNSLFDSEIMSKLANVLGSNQDAFIGMSAGLLGGQGFGGGLAGMMEGGKLDALRARQQKAEAEKKAKADALRQFFAGRNLSPEVQAVVATNPELAGSLFEKAITPKEARYEKVGNDLIRINPDGSKEIVHQSEMLPTPEMRNLAEAGVARGSDEWRARLLGTKPLTPYETETQKKQAQNEDGWRTTAEGAENYLRKVERLKAAVAAAGDDAFGPVQGGPVGRFFGSMVGTDAEKARQKLDAELAGIELDVAKMELKGQGQVTESERAIARKKIGGLTVNDAATQQTILDGLAADARATLAQAAKMGVYKPPAEANLPVVKTPEEAAALPPGTRFIGPDGKERVRP